MRIGIYMPETMPSDGGAHTFLEEILVAIADLADSSGHEWILLSWGPRKPAGWPENIAFHSIWPAWLRPALAALPNFRKPSRTRARGCPCAAWQLPGAEKWFDRAVSETRVDLVWHATPDWMVSPRKNIRTVWDLEHRHLPFFPEVSASGTWIDRERGYQRTMRRATLVLTGTSQNQQEIAFYYQVPIERVRVVPLPTPALKIAPDADPADGAQKLREELGLEPGFLLYPAQFWPHKNHVNLLHALAALDRKIDHRFRLVCCGSDAGNRPHVQETARQLGLEDRVLFPGLVSREILTLLYQHAFSLVYPSFFGPDNLPPLEACRLGCPVLTADWAGAREQIGQAALFFNPADPEDIAAKIQTLHESPALRQELITAGRSQVGSRTPRDYVETVLREIARIGKNG